MLIKVNKDEIIKDNIIYFKLGENPEMIPSRIARVAYSDSDIAYIEFNVEELSVCNDKTTEDFFIKPILRKKERKDYPKGTPMGEVVNNYDKWPIKIQTMTYMQFIGEVQNITNSKELINRYTKNPAANAWYVDVLSANNAKFTITLQHSYEFVGMHINGSIPDNILESLRPGDIIAGTVSTASIITKPID